MKQVFLSYARADSSKATLLYKQLRRCLSPQIHVWFDREDILAGAKWDPAIRRAIRESDYFIALMSHKAVTNRGFRHTELREALDMSREFPDDWIFLMPTRLDECPMPFEEMRVFSYTDLFPEAGDWKRGVAKLCRDIRGAAGRHSVKGAAGQAMKIPAAKPRPRAKPSADVSPTPEISYDVSLVDLGKVLPTVGRIVKGLSRAQSIFRFSSERLVTPRRALTRFRGQEQLYLTDLNESFYKRIGLIKTDYVIGLTKPMLAFDENGYVYYNYLAYQLPKETRMSFISYANLSDYAAEAGITLDAAIGYVVVAELVDHFLNLDYHKQTRNCPMDFARDHSDLIEGLRAGHFCRYCSRTLNKSEPFGSAFKAMIAWGR